MKTPVSLSLLLIAIVSLFIPQPSVAQDRGLRLGRPVKTQGQTESRTGKQGQPELIVQTGYRSFSGLSEMKFSTDGRMLAMSLRGGSVKLWEVTTGRELRTFGSQQNGELDDAQPLAFSPDSRYLAVGGSDAVIRVWDVLTGRQVRELPPRSDETTASPIRYIAFKPDGRTLISVSDTVSVRDITTGFELNSFKLSLRKRLKAGAPVMGAGIFALSLDGTHLLTTDTAPGEGIKRQGVAQVNDPARWGEAEFVAEVRVELMKTSSRVAAASTVRRVMLPGVESHAEVSMRAAAFNLDGAALLAGIDGGKLKLWNVTAGTAPAILATDLSETATLFFSPTAQLIGAMTDTTLRLWDSGTGRLNATLKLPSESAMELHRISPAVALSHDGRFLATIRKNSALTLWDVTAQNVARRIVGSGNQAYSVSFSSDGKQLISGGRTRWDLAEGVGIRYVSTGAETGDLKVPSPQGDKLVTINRDNNTVSMFDAASGVRTRFFSTPPGAGKLKQFFFAPNGRILLAIYSAGDQKTKRRQGQDEGVDTQLRLWDAETGSELNTLHCPQGVQVAAVSGDGRYLATADRRGKVTLWDVGSRLALQTISRFITQDGTIVSPASGRAVQQPLKGDASSGAPLFVSTLAFSPDGKVLATGAETAGAEAGVILLWDTATGQSIGQFRDEAAAALAHLTFSADGKRLTASKADRTILILDVATGGEVSRLTGHRANINSLAFSPDGRLLASADDDGSTYLWDAAKGEHLATLVSMFDGGEWLVITPDGLFDGTPTSLNQILWRYDEDTFNIAPVEWFFNEFYQPGLLADLVAGKRPKAAQSFELKERRQPRVSISLGGVQNPAAKVTERNVKLRIQVAEEPPSANAMRGSGAQDLRLFRNGSLVKYWRGDLLGDRLDAVFETTVPIIAGENSFIAYAFNRDNVKSVDARFSLTGDESLKRGGIAYIVSVGINEYANAHYNLRFAVPDARTFTDEVISRQNRLRLYEKVEFITLYDRAATKENILRALAEVAAKAQPEDGVAIYYAGHGTAQNNQFYLVPHDLGYAGERGKLSREELEALLAHSISDRELEAAFEQINSGRLILVLDTCNSGQALEAEEQRRGPMNSKGLAQLAYEKGMYVLAASQSFQAAQEVEQLGHGLLTYALVEEGLKMRAADFKPRDGSIVIREWFEYATTRVPQIQIEKIRQVRSNRSNLPVADGARGLLGALQSVQRPRVFYRRELETNPLIIDRQ